MALVKCPKCENTVSDVASVCPHCGFAVAGDRWSGPDGGLTMLCHRCSVRISVGAPVCCNCGVQDPRPRRSLFKPGMIGLAAASALVILSGGVWFAQPTADAPEPKTVVAAVAEPSVPAPATPQAQAPLKSTPKPIPRRVAGDPVRGAPVTTVLLWTRTWANVREGRGTESAVVEILEPGVSIEVADRESHWWAVIEGGARIGYVANSVLTSDPTDVAEAPPLMSHGN